jgi:hypothetical protein
MKRTAAITIGVVLSALALTGCSDEEQNADYSEVCLDAQNVRVDDDRCDDDSSHNHWMWFPYVYAVPAYGSHVDTSKGVTTRPTTGTIARPPATGGFGTTRTGTVGS